MGNLKLAITLEKTEILGHQRPTGVSRNEISAFQRFKSNSFRKVPENKDYPLKHPKIAFTKKALCREINLNVAFHIPNPVCSIKKWPFHLALGLYSPPHGTHFCLGLFFFSVIMVMGNLED